MTLLPRIEVFLKIEEGKSDALASLHLASSKLAWKLLFLTFRKPQATWRGCVQCCLAGRS